jgi:molybdenum cofactor cytidylyltransferase
LKKSKKIVALILAAGESCRLGKPKQNLMYKGKTLLNHTKEHLTLNIVEQIFVVLGAYSHEIQKVSGLRPAEVVEFKGWKEGMGSSLSYACSKIFAENNYDGILITLSDLPLVEKADYQKMIELFKSPSDIVATKANDSMGVPAIFGSDYFDKLLQLKGHQGAKKIITRYGKNVVKYRNENASFDIDTMEDYLKLHQKK